MERWENKVAVVTGASSGIGLATSQILVQKGVNVVGLARRQEKMIEGMAGVKGKGKFYPVKCDVTNKKEVAEAFEWIKKNVGVVQIMVNNAGCVKSGAISDTLREDWENVFNINVLGLLDCTKHAVNVMKTADVEGHIININSILGHFVPQTSRMSTNVYCASKFAVTAITDTLRQELIGGKIRTTSISPGYVKTEILKLSGLQLDTSKMPGLESEDVADAIAYVLGLPHRVHITELTIKPLGEP